MASSIVIILSVCCIHLSCAFDLPGDAFSSARKSIEETRNLARIGQFGDHSVFDTILDIGDKRKESLELIRDGDYSALSHSSYPLSDTCANHTAFWIVNLLEKQPWALKMFDAAGKPPSNILDGNFIWLGSYDECMQISVPASQSPPQTSFEGRFCGAMIPVKGSPVGFVITMCVPDSCNELDVMSLIDGGIGLLPINTTNVEIKQVTCKYDKHRELDSRAIAVIAVCSFFGFLLFAGTAYDVIVVKWLHNQDRAKLHEVSIINGYTNLADETIGLANGHTIIETSDASPNKPNYGSIPPSSKKIEFKPGLLGKVLMSFSVYTNGTKLLSTDQGAGSLRAVNGIRFVSMTWVILGHTYAFGIQFGDNAYTYLGNKLNQFPFQAIANETVAVDTFFALSGLLVAYLTLKEIKKAGGWASFKWHIFYIHRYWRLTPPYMLFLMFHVALTKYFGAGPLWPEDGFEQNYCRDTWWTNLLYVNNLVRVEKQCMAWSWYLANDMQFYILSPFILIPLYISGILGALVGMVFIIASCIVIGVIVQTNNYPAAFAVGGNENTDKYFVDVYMKPYCRIGPYVIGLFTGYILYKTDCKIKMSKLVAFLGWTAAAVINISVLYGLYNPNNDNPLSQEVSSLYSALNRLGWGLGVCWVVLACATGYGGFVDTLLSWKGIIPLSRLTYCAYLVHPVVIYVYVYNQQTLPHFSDLIMVYVFLGHLCLSYAVAFIVSLTFESPMMALEKILLKRDRRN